MGKYVLVYTGGAMAEDEAAQQEAMGRSTLTGYSKGCPVLSTGGSVEVYEAMPIG